MAKVKISIGLKVTIMILALITFVVTAIGAYTIYNQAKQLEADMVSTVTRTATTFGFLSSRAIVDGDDLALADNLQSMKEIPGFVYGQIINAQTKNTIVQLFADDLANLAKNKEKVDQILKERTDQVWNHSFATENPKSKVEPLAVEGTNITLYNFYYPAFHPFILENRPLLGMVQIVISNEYIQQRTRKSAIELSLTAIAFWVLGGLGSVLLSRLIVKPINILAEGAQIVGDGNLDYKVQVTTEDELGALAMQFNAMTDSLQEAQKEKEEQLVINEQIKQAQEIQEGMNPMQKLDTDHFQVKGFTRAAKGVGGDYFDFQALPDGRLALLISDVSGKSISASLVMVLIKTVFATYLRLFDTIRCDAIMSTINKVMASQAHIDKFATMIFLIYEPKTGYVEFTNGGQGPLFIYRAQKKVCTSSKLPGLPLGIDEDNDYSVAKVRVHPGDMIVLYTDGITEAMNTEKVQYEVSGLRAKIIEYAERDVQEIVNDIITDIDEFADGMEQHDDMTLVILKFK